MSKATPGPWEHVAATVHHGHFIVAEFGSTICDLYAMTDPTALSVRNGGTSRPIDFMDAEANARLIAAAPDLLDALKGCEVALQECANILRDTLPSLADNVIGSHAREARAAIAKATGEAA